MLISNTASGVFQVKDPAQALALPRARMKALMKEGREISVQLIPRPQLIDAQSVIVRVAIAGLCRTDLYAAEGKIKVCNPLVLGHEFSGIIEEVGAGVEGYKPGQRVTVNPVLPCFKCKLCLTGQLAYCQESTFLGVDRCGCFAEFVCVPQTALLLLPEGISDLAAAYTEPVAASLAVLKAGIKGSERGLIYGKNRFSQLMEQILSAESIKNIQVFDPSIDRIEDSVFDYVIETSVSTEAIPQMVRAIKPGGKIILKSRQYEPIAIRMTELLKKEPVMHVVNYGSFEDAVNWLASGKIDVNSLVDGVYDLEDYAKVLAAAKRKEALKPFFAPSGKF